MVKGLSYVVAMTKVTILQKSRTSITHVEVPPRCEYYFKVYKPYGVICSHARDVPDAPIVSDLYPPGAKECHNVGRLDRNSEAGGHQWVQSYRSVKTLTALCADCSREELFF